MLDRTLSALAGLSLRHSKGIAIVAFAVAALSVAGALQLTIEPTPGPPDEHIVITNAPLIHAIGEGYRNSARVDRVEIRGDRLIVKPKEPARDVRFSRALLAEASIIEARAMKNAKPPLPAIRHEGGYAAAVAEVDHLRQGLLITTVVSFASVLVLFVIAFRRAGYGGPTIAVALAMTFAFAALVHGPLTARSVGFAAILIGIGGAWSVLLYGRYAQERSGGDTTAHALIVAVQRVVPIIVITAVVLTAAFLFFDPLIAAGIVFLTLAMMFVLPSLIVIGERYARHAPPRPRLMRLAAALALIVPLLSLLLLHR